tara:strand:+ start:10473 stop:10745 length:273 start_codon:yes stop_codon:yes gene_type:complete
MDKIMSDTKFTKGEWKIQDDGYGMIGVLLKKGIGILVGRKSKEAQANAHLIAAAPEMYEMLNEIAVSMECFHGVDTNSIYELLAKARGES